MKDFSRPKTDTPSPPIEFSIDGDVFYAHPRVGGKIVDDAMDLREFGDLLNIDPAEATKEEALALGQAVSNYNMRLVAFLDKVLLPESAELYAARMLSVDKPIDKPTSQDVVRFLIEEYSKPHPTQPLSPSTNGQGGTGASSTATASTST